MSNKFDPKGGKADGLPHQVSAGTPGGANGSHNKGGLPMSANGKGAGELSGGNALKAGKRTGAGKSRESFLGGKREAGFAVVTK
jgi:hypothetical protein